jgi:hypothetical protein
MPSISSKSERKSQFLAVSKKMPTYHRGIWGSIFGHSYTCQSKFKYHIVVKSAPTLYQRKSLGIFMHGRPYIRSTLIYSYPKTDYSKDNTRNLWLVNLLISSYKISLEDMLTGKKRRKRKKYQKLFFDHLYLSIANYRSIGLFSWIWSY